MLCLFSSKGGVGCSVTAAALAAQSAARRPTLLVDLRGDLDLLLGVPRAGQGLSDWFAVDRPGPDLLHRVEIPVGDGLSLLPRGSCRSPARPDRYRLLARLLRDEARSVVVDVGTHALPAVAVVAEATTSLLVTRACFLALEAARCGPTPDAVVLIEEEGRQLKRRQIEDVLGAPVSVAIRWHRDVARAADSGLLEAKLPRPLRQLEVML